MLGHDVCPGHRSKKTIAQTRRDSSLRRPTASQERGGTKKRRLAPSQRYALLGGLRLRAAKDGVGNFQGSFHLFDTPILMGHASNAALRYALRGSSRRTPSGYG